MTPCSASLSLMSLKKFLIMNVFLMGGVGYLVCTTFFFHYVLEAREQDNGMEQARIPQRYLFLL